MTGAAPWVIDGRGLQGGSGVRGIGSYLRGLLGGLHDLGVDERVELLLRRSDPPPDLPPGWAARPGPRLPALKRRLQPLADPFLVAAVLLRRPAALYHAVEYAQPIVARAPVVVTVHDLIPFVVRDGYTWMRRERLLAVRQLRHAEAVITPSQATADGSASSRMGWRRRSDRRRRSGWRRLVSASGWTGRSCSLWAPSTPTSA